MQQLSVEMRHASPLRCANVVGLVHGLLMIPPPNMGTGQGY